MASDLSSYRYEDRIIFLAHRGNGPTNIFEDSSNSFPENTIIAFRKGINDGADGIETDVHLSKDKIPIVIHSNELNQIVKGANRFAKEGDSDYLGTVGNNTSEELKLYDLGFGQRLATLEEVIILLSEEKLTKQNQILNIEFKTDGEIVRLTHEIVSKYVLDKKIKPEKVIYCSFNYDALKEISQSPYDVSGTLFPLVAPAVRTITFFGAENVGENFYVKPGLKYTESCMELLYKLTNDFGEKMSAFSVFIWDIEPQLIHLVNQMA